MQDSLTSGIDSKIITWRKLKPLVVIVILVLLFIFNVRYLSRFFDWDSSVYTLNIQRDRIHSVFFNPHHLGFESTGYLFWKTAKSIFPNADIMFTLRIRILISSLIFLYFFITMMDKLYNDFIGSLLLGFCVSFTQAFWFYSHHNDTPLIHSCLVVLLYLSLVITARTGMNFLRMIGIGILHLGTLYFHQSNAILFPMVLVGFLITDKWKNKDWNFSSRMMVGLIYNSVIGILIILSYVLVGFGILGRELGAVGEKHFSFWLFLYAAQERWGMSGSEKNYFLYFYRGIGDAFLNFQGVNERFRVNFNNDWNIKNTPYNLNLLFWIFILLSGLLNIRRLGKLFSKEVILLSFWLIPSILFYTWWEGYFFEFWVGVTTGLWIVAYLIMKSFDFEQWTATSKAIRNVILLIAGSFFFIVNFTFSTLPRSKGIQYGYLEGFKDKVEKIANEKIYFKNN
ncbi:hypothetical protein [Leptospira sp. GIMC2001]|uniref:hypothetical protein n=1 Tax=Leptospira sp. GIMC2001 TaxID=1513297 RepID=UPI002349A2F8|nr:hypothetical protein [Leptospira sp. GIMC2001]WCL47636.1 hypothetical protein O4O04_01320 [Leptospira sp. GIMC2001]